MGELVKTAGRFELKKWSNRIDEISKSARFADMKNALDENMPQLVSPEDLPQFKIVGRILLFPQKSISLK